ncbi:MAG: glycine cleavage system protein H, partial [Actinomycetota bacterium]
MTNTPSNLKYTKEHEWVEERGLKVIRFGITDYAQGALGD